MHTQNWQYLTGLKKENNIPSFWIFSGVKGIQKFEFAKKWARYIVRAHTQLHPNIFLVDKGNKEIKIDDILKVKKFLSKKNEDWQFVIIDNANKMNNYASNALLKSFEEKYKKTIIILIAHMFDILIPTIKSRFHKLNFYPSFEDILKKDNKFIEIEKYINQKIIPEPFIHKNHKQSQEILEYMTNLSYHNFLKTKDKKFVKIFERLNRFMGEITSKNLSGYDILYTAFLLYR